MKLEIEKMEVTKEEFLNVFSNFEKVIFQAEDKEKISKTLIINFEEMSISEEEKEQKFKEIFPNHCISIKTGKDYIIGFSEEDETIDELVENFRDSFKKTDEAAGEEEKIEDINDIEKVFEERQLGSKIAIIIKNEELVTKIKEHCENINQYTYILKNNINFMTFYYIKIIQNKSMNYDNYEKIYEWYKNLSETKIKVKEYNINYSVISENSFLNQKSEYAKLESLLDSLFKFFSRNKYLYEEFKKKEKEFNYGLLNPIKEDKIFDFLERKK
ncbi:MAG: hypothetical protein KBE03_03635 [Leptotrichiaceae bacterium]|mgnify:CR=1 FL=1|nr:hypothetical protein [Leptotrichiaceae bacterium]